MIMNVLSIIWAVAALFTVSWTHPFYMAEKPCNGSFVRYSSSPVTITTARFSPKHTWSSKKNPLYSFK